MLLQRWEAKTCRKEKSPPPGIKLVMSPTRSPLSHPGGASGKGKTFLKLPNFRLVHITSIGKWQNEYDSITEIFFWRHGKHFGKKKMLFASIFSLSCDVFNSLPNDKILDLSKLKGFADDKRNMTQKLKFVSVRVENIVRKGESAGYHHFLLFRHCF